MTPFRFSTNAASQWFQWLLVTALGMAGGIGISAYIIFYILPRLNQDTNLPFDVMMILSMGVLTGILQWWLLRHRIRQGWRWIPASLSGYLVILVLVSLSNKFHLTSFKGPWDDMALMACAAGMQAFSLGSVAPTQHIWEMVWLGFMMGAILGAVTGIMWVWLLQSGHNLRTNFSKAQIGT